MDSEMKYATIETALGTAKEAYTGVFVHNGTATMEGILDEMAKRGAIAQKGEARLVLRVAAGVLREIVAGELKRVNLGAISFEPAISGSVPHMDSPLGDENKIYVNIRAGDAIRNGIGMIVPKLAHDIGAYPDAPRIDRVEDATTGNAEIRGTDAFIVTGKGLSLAWPGEEAALVGKDGTIAPLLRSEGVGDGGDSGERLYLHLPLAVEPGDWTLRIKTHSGPEGTGALVTLEKKVNVK